MMMTLYKGDRGRGVSAKGDVIYEQKDGGPNQPYDVIQPLTNEEDKVSDVPEPSDAVAISDGGGSVLTILDLKAWLRNPWKAIQVSKFLL